MSSSALAACLRHLRRQLAARQPNQESDEQLLHAFLTRRDEDAFAVLVRRHGPMVLHVCRRVLGHEQDAEDAFQATFLVLAQNAASLRNKTMLAGFLHGTAYRTAMKVKQSAARRRKHEGQAPTRPPADPADELSWREVRGLIDEEIARLPEKYRSVFVLCCLEELSRAEAAQRLGLKERTVLSRLAEARKRLSQRLARRGVELTAILAASVLAAQPASALPAGLAASTIKAALAMSAGEKLAGVVSVSVAALVQSATAAMVVSKAKIATVMLLAVTLLGGTGAWAYRGLAANALMSSPLSAGPPAVKGDDKPKAAPPKREAAKTVEIQGRVVDTDDKPVRGAKILFLYPSFKKAPKKIWATSTEDGRFAFTVPPGQVASRYSEKPWEDTYVMAAAEGYGFAVARLGKPGAADLTLRLVKDDVPIQGRILDLQGKPVAGARVRIYGSLYVPEKGDLTAWLAAIKDPNRDPNLGWWSNLTLLNSPAFDLLFPPVTTGSDGRFCIKGIGRERLAELYIEGRAIATQAIHAMTRPQEAIHLSKDKDHPKKRPISYFGSAFDLVAVPSRPVVGVVRDKDSGEPLAGVKIESELVVNSNKSDFLRTVTDKEGRYRLAGLPKGEGIKIAATTKDFPQPSESDLTEQPAYLSAVKNVGNPLGIEPVTVDFALKRGVWIKGRVIDKITGKALGAHIEYFCFIDNPNAKELPISVIFYHQRWSTEDGLFLIPALPGRGLIAVRADKDHYLMGAGAEKIMGGRVDGSPDFLSTVPYHCVPANYHMLVEINPKQTEEAVTCNIALEGGRSLKGTVFGPDGKPLAGARISGLKDMGYWLDAGAEFTVESLQPNKPRVLQFVHESKKLAGVFVLRGDEKEPISVRLEPWCMLNGRLIPPQDELLTDMQVYCSVQVKWNGEYLHTTMLLARVGKDGCFRIEGLAPGLKYHKFTVLKGAYLRRIVGGGPGNLTLKAGETKDLGDLQVKPKE